jgi:hypothetical protein
MREAVRRGLEIRREHGIVGVASETDVDAVLAALGLTIEEDYPFAGRLRGMLVRDTVYVRRRLSTRERCWIKLHEAGHRVLHAPDPVAAYQRARGPVPSPRGGRREREAELFAGAVMAGEPEEGDTELGDWMETAHADGVPADLLWELASLFGRSRA